MPDKTTSRPSSVSTDGSLMQHVPGAFPAPPQFRPEDQDDEDPQEVTYQSLSQAVYARRAEYVRARRIRIKVGTWNVAAYKGAEKDVGPWFVGAQGIAERLTGLDIHDTGHAEQVAQQELRYQKNNSTVPIGDTGGDLPKGDEVGLYVLGLQEVVDVNSATEALRPYTDPSAAKKWKDAMQTALPPGYQLVAEQQLIGLLLLVYAAPHVAPDVKSVSTTSVGTGLMGYMGNKGAVTARIVLGETTRLVFINCHLAAGADKTALERRNWDAQQIVSRTRFEPIRDAMDLAQTTGEQLGQEDFAFWCGDLNYRLEGIPGNDVRRLLMLHTRNEYDLSQQSERKIDKELHKSSNSAQDGGDGSSVPSARSSIEGQRSIDNSRTHIIDDGLDPSEDPTSLQTTLSSLLPHDELHQQMKARKAFEDGWQEGPITFLPTYKYDPGSVGIFDSSEKRRAPSWCDRILYRTRRDKLSYDKAVRDELEARKKDAEWEANGTDLAANDEEILYDYDPDADGADANDESNEIDEYDEGEDGVVITKEGFEDEIQLEYYTAHQRVLSSDHKPLDASFVLKYDAVVPELKAKIHAEVAREMDKAENEGRPNVTVVVDRHQESSSTSEEKPPDKFDGVWFGDIRWSQNKHRSLTVANTSRVESTFTFIGRPVEDGQTPGIAPKWLTLKINDMVLPSEQEKSSTVTLDPGETCSVDLELRITETSDAKELNDGKQCLEDILVLRVDNGRDHFIPVRAHWLESSLGRSLDRLVRIPEGGIRKLQRQKPEAKAKVTASAVTAVNEMSKGIGRTLSAAQDSAESLGRKISHKSTPSSSSSKTQDGDDDDANPVRFSAPRELFRLTEAVEELSTRVIAEWEMMYAVPVTPNSPRASSEEVPSPTAPWIENPGWPFAEECWTERSTTHWTAALSDACNALDEDLSLDGVVPETPRIQRLYVLCCLLLLFLKSMPDGVISIDMWPGLEHYLTEMEKAKKKQTNEELRADLQEMLATTGHSWNNISFFLVTSMLERMIQERYSPALDDLATNRARANSHNEASTSSRLSPKRAGGTLKRIVTGKSNAPTLSQLDSAGRKDKTVKTWSKIFADAMIRSPEVTGEKAKTQLLKRREGLLETFLRRD